MRRMLYFGAGAVTALWARRRLVAALDRYTPISLRDAAVGRARRLGGDMRAAVGDGRAAMAERQRQLRTTQPTQPTQPGIEPDTYGRVDASFDARSLPRPLGSGG